MSKLVYAESTVTVTAEVYANEYEFKFDNWKVTVGEDVYKTVTEEVYEFAMPNHDISFEAVYEAVYGDDEDPVDPTLSNVDITNISKTTATLKAQGNVEGYIKWVVLPDNQPNPSADQIVEAIDDSSSLEGTVKAGYKETSGDELEEISITGLNAGTSYKAHVFLYSNDNEKSEVTSKTFKTNSSSSNRGPSGGPSSSRDDDSDTTGDVNKSVISEDSSVEKTTTVVDGKTVETFTVKAEVTEQIEEAKEDGKETVEIKIDSSETATTEINISKDIIKSAEGLNLAITTPNATLELPAALVDALAEAGQDLDITVERGDADEASANMSGVAGAEGATVLGTPTVINTDIEGKTNVNIPLTGIEIPTNEQKREAFLDSLAVFAMHSDGEKNVIEGTITYDEDGIPIGISFEVDKFSTFAVIQLAQATKEIKLTIGQEQASINGNPYTLDAKPFITEANRTLVPVRFVSEAIGAEVNWIAEDKQAVIKDGDTEIILTTGSDKVMVNGVQETLDAPAEIVENRTFVPLRFVSENLGAEVDYTTVTEQITIIK
ncbi:MAG: hypothetical protein FH756_06995 [Firmicutes bacterium]|nr:hypothetical protein [Bacillota bacterium]